MKFVAAIVFCTWLLDQLVQRITFRARYCALIDQAEADLMFAATRRGPL